MVLALATAALMSPSDPVVAKILERYPMPIVMVDPRVAESAMPMVWSHPRAYPMPNMLESQFPELRNRDLSGRIGHDLERLARANRLVREVAEARPRSTLPPSMRTPEALRTSDR